MLARLRVPLAWAVGALVLYLSRPVPLALMAGVPLAVLGEGIRLWASGHIEKGRALATGGPYAHTRNPLYLGSALIALGAAAASASPWALLVIAAYFAVFYPAAIRQEAASLRERFPAEYGEWERAVPAFLPRLRPAGPWATRFEWGRVRANREWRTCLALPLVLALLYARRWLP